MLAINASDFLMSLGIDCKLELQQFESIGMLIAESWNKAFDAAPVVQEYLHKRGWSVSNEFTPGHFVSIRDFASREAHLEADEFMATFVEEIKERVKKRIIDRFPERQHIITDAFQAHDERKYTLSIPTLLSQADGIGCKLFSTPPKSFFTQRERDKKIDEALKVINPTNLNVLDEYKGLILLALKKQICLDQQTATLAELQRTDPSYGPLNRHGVLHGVHVDFATHHNSLRCISLLDYILDVQDVLTRELPKAVKYEKDKQEQISKLWERVQKSQ